VTGRAGGAPAGGGPGLRRFVKAPSPEPASAPAGPVFPAAVASQLQAGRPQAAAEEACEFCAAPIAAEHGHVADLEQATLMCACRACYLLFTNTSAGLTRADAGQGRYRAVPDRYLSDPARPLSAAEWDSLEVPVGLAFFLRTAQGNEVTGFYPSPAGATECRLDLQAWERIAASRPMLTAAEPDVEAVLIFRDQDRVEYFLVPIDACYELAGRMRLLWRGFDGGSEARQSITEFLDGVRSRARVFSREP
jgi:Family of unknown function (DUF5947)